MDIPKFNETFLPILKALMDGYVIASKGLYKEVENTFYAKIDEELKDLITRSGHRLGENKIAWRKSHLK